MSKHKGLVQGFGINDVKYSITKTENVNGKFKITWRCPYYVDWANMLERCYSLKFKERRNTYKDCTICDDWRCLSDFIKWVDSQPNKGWMNCQLDKDLLLLGNKHYSPQTCVYISGSLNSFMIDGNKVRGSCMIGASYQPEGSNKNPYDSKCSNPFTGKADYLGIFPTELEAHKAWQAKKHEHACKLAELQDDPRVADALRQRYAPDKDWTNK